VRFTQLTHDGQRKSGPILSDGVRIYFNEGFPDGRTVIAQVSVKGGEVTPLSLPIKAPTVRDLSRDGTELLIASKEEGGFERSIWIQPVAGGSPLRIGSILAGDAAFSADGTGIIYSQGHDVYAANRDGSSPRKLFTVEYSPAHFRFSPDRKLLRFTQNDNSDNYWLMSAAADGTELHKMFPAGPGGDWSPDGRYFILVRREPGYTSGHLEVWSLSELKAFPWTKQDSEPIRLTSGPFEFRWPVAGKDEKEIFALAVNGRAEVIRYDSGSHKFAPYLDGISAEGLAFSPDRQWVAYTSFPDGTLWRSRVDGSERLQLSSPPMRVFLPRWYADRLQCNSSRAGHLEYLCHLERGRLGRTHTTQRPEPGGCGVVARREVSDLRLRVGTERRHPYPRLEIPACLYFARLRGILFSPLVSGWQIHFGHDRRIPKVDALRHLDTEVDETVRLSSGLPDVVA
jgi:Tol biopolymer transport system component